MSPIVTGADIFRVKTILTAAQIRGLDSSQVLIAPGIPGKTLKIVAYLQQFNFQSEAWNSSGLASVYYGLSAVSPLGGGSTLSFINSATESVDGGNLIGDTNDAPFALSDVQSAGLFLRATTPGFNAGSAVTATVDPAAQGLLYADNDTGTIQVTGDATDPDYMVTGTGAGGLVTTLTVTGGTGVTIGGPFPTTVVTGSGDGTLEVSITAIRPLGDGTVEIDVLYQPI